MPYDELLAKRIRNILTPHEKHLEEKKMIGGLCFMYKGKMSCGIVKEDLMVRVLSEKYESCLQQPHCRVMDFTGKVLKGFLYVGSEGIQTDKQLRSWLELGIEFVDKQVPKTKKTKAKKTAKK
jgi:TfoX/Sxy family transcriptional regulator of competence genes